MVLHGNQLDSGQSLIDLVCRRVGKQYVVPGVWVNLQEIDRYIAETCRVTSIYGIQVWVEPFPMFSQKSMKYLGVSL
jgi:hypothetical protein